MRRLAKQNREDRVRSRRDYQTISERQGIAFKVHPSRSCRTVFQAKVKKRGNVPFIGVGVYLRTDVPTDLRIQLTPPTGEGRTKTFRSGIEWGGFGITARASKLGDVRVQIETTRGVSELDVWGLNCGWITAPDAMVQKIGDNEAALNTPGLVPEGFYLTHDEPISIDPIEDDWVGVSIASTPGPPISVKKCAYCQRYLPLDPKRPSALAFHKHNAKLTGHQNECRACKKWRINDTFNPKRTTDQLHESSVITRERRFFLRDPEILERIKDRNGAGLKSIVWRRFDRRCFRCGRELPIQEVRLDHTRPMAYLWPIDEHATCLCEDCNNHKRERFPVDVFTEKQLRELSRITGLSYEDLTKKELNRAELRRILADLPGFARQWDPRTFNAIARKIRELRPTINLFEILRQEDLACYTRITSRLKKRPPSVAA